MTHRLPLRPHLLKVPLPPRNTILGSEPRLLICHLIPNGPLNAYSGLSPCMVSEEAPISLTAPGSLGSNLRPCRRWEGGGVPGSSAWELGSWHSVPGWWHGGEAWSSWYWCCLMVKVHFSSPQETPLGNGLLFRSSRKHHPNRVWASVLQLLNEILYRNEL